MNVWSERRWVLIHWYSGHVQTRNGERAWSCFTLQPLHLPGLEDILGKPGKLCVYVDL